MKLNKKIIALIVVIVVVLAGGYYSTRPSPTTETTTSYSTSLSNVFSVNSFWVVCHSDGRLDASFMIANSNGASFSLLSAKVVLLNYTLNNGTMLRGNQLFSGSDPTLATTHRINGHFQLAVEPSGLMKAAWVMILLNVDQTPTPNPIFLRILGCSSLS